MGQICPNILMSKVTSGWRSKQAEGAGSCSFNILHSCFWSSYVHDSSPLCPGRRWSAGSCCSSSSHHMSVVSLQLHFLHFQTFNTLTSLIDSMTCSSQSVSYCLYCVWPARLSLLPLISKTKLLFRTSQTLCCTNIWPNLSVWLITRALTALMWLFSLEGWILIQLSIYKHNPEILTDILWWTSSSLMWFQ